MRLLNRIRRNRELKREEENRRFREMLKRVENNCVTEDEARAETIKFVRRVIGQTNRETVLSDFDIDKHLITTEFDSGKGKLIISRNGAEYKANISSVSVDFTHYDHFNISYTIEGSGEKYSKNYGNFNIITSKREDENGNIIWGFGAGSEYDHIIIEVLK